MKQIISDLVDGIGFITFIAIIIMAWAWLERCYA